VVATVGADGFCQTTGAVVSEDGVRVLGRREPPKMRPPPMAGATPVASSRAAAAAAGQHKPAARGSDAVRATVSPLSKGFNRDPSDGRTDTETDEEDPLPPRPRPLPPLRPPSPHSPPAAARTPLHEPAVDGVAVAPMPTASPEPTPVEEEESFISSFISSSYSFFSVP